MNYSSIKELAKLHKCRVTDLIALAPNNDPFYAGTPGDWAVGEWFSELWQRFGYGYGVHIRRVHYQIISQDTPVLMPNGLPYENTETCWNFLSQASKMARYLDLVDPGAFVDRRNPEPHVFAVHALAEPSIDVHNYSWGAADFPSFPDLPDYYIHNYEGQQRYHLEIWCEKSTMNDVLLPLCGQYRVNLVTGVGEMSITSVLELTRRMNGKPVRIFYVSDFDPAGQSMPCAVARKVEYFQHKHGDDADVMLFPIVLTAEQVQQYRLPRTPIKETEKRAGRFEERYGAGAVELDALEALHPGELARVLRTEIGRYYDRALDGRVFDAKAALGNELDNIRQAVIDAHQTEIDALRAEYEAIRGDFERRMGGYGRRLESLWQAISDELEEATPDVDDYPVPEADEANERPGALYDSERDYLDQMTHYKRYQGKDEVQP